MPDDVVAEMERTGEALCAYRPATIEGVYLKAAYMRGCFVFVAVGRLQHFKVLGDLTESDWTRGAVNRALKPDDIVNPIFHPVANGFGLFLRVAPGRAAVAALAGDPVDRPDASQQNNEE